VESLYKDEHKVTLGIWHRDDEKLIGNVGLFDIHSLHRVGELGIVIGDSKYHSGGYGTEVITEVVQYGFNIRNLRHITLKVLSSNPRAIACYKKCRFKEIGVLPQFIFKGAAWQDEHIMIITNPNLMD